MRPLPCDYRRALPSWGVMTPGPEQSYLEFAAQPAAAPWARRLTRDALGCWRVCAELIDNVELAVSELVTNAIGRAERNDDTRGLARIALTLRCSAADVAVEVTDSDPHLPQPSVLPAAEAEHGRGLFLVASYAREWGAFRLPSGGKCVWCLFDRVPGRSHAVGGTLSRCSVSAVNPAAVQERAQ